jgi:hypothetical protein
MPPSGALSRLQPGGCGGRAGRALLDAVPWRLQHKRNDTEDCVSDDDSDDEGMTLTSPSEPPSDKRNAPDDCHVLIRCSQLQNLVKQTMECAHCGLTVATFKRWTIGIATEIEFSCSVCKAFETARALQTDYVVNDSLESNPRTRVDYYELNWRLIMATELLGESQVGGSIIGLMLDLTTDAFRNKWTEMELQLGVG